MSDPVRSRQARELAERALVRLVAAYGEVPEFVLLGGLVPDLLCSEAADRHVGTTDVDVQVDLEIQGGSVNAVRLEGALREAGFIPDSQRVWRWKDQVAAGQRVRDRFEAALVGPTETALGELAANFASVEAQGSVAYAATMLGLHPELDYDVLANDAVAAVGDFTAALGMKG